MSIEKITLKVEGMSCQHCVNAVKTAVSELDGSSVVDVDLENKLVMVEFDADKISIKDLIDTIEDQGYDVIQ